MFFPGFWTSRGHWCCPPPLSALSFFLFVNRGQPLQCASVFSVLMFLSHALARSADHRVCTKHSLLACALSGTLILQPDTSWHKYHLPYRRVRLQSQTRSTISGGFLVGADCVGTCRTRPLVARPAIYWCLKKAEDIYGTPPQ